MRAFRSRRQSEFAANKSVKATDISGSTPEGAVTLTGTVATAKEKAHATSIAKKIKGAKSVDASGLTVGAAGCTATPFADPQDLPGVGIEDDGGVTVPLVQGKLTMTKRRGAAGGSEASTPSSRCISSRRAVLRCRPNMAATWAVGSRSHP